MSPAKLRGRTEATRAKCGIQPAPLPQRGGVSPYRNSGAAEQTLNHGCPEFVFEGRTGRKQRWREHDQ